DDAPEHLVQDHIQPPVASVLEGLARAVRIGQREALRVEPPVGKLTRVIPGAELDDSGRPRCRPRRRARSTLRALLVLAHPDWNGIHRITDCANQRWRVVDAKGRAVRVAVDRTSWTGAGGVAVEDCDQEAELGSRGDLDPGPQGSLWISGAAARKVRRRDE